MLLNGQALKTGETLRDLSGTGATAQASAKATTAPAQAGGGGNAGGGDTPSPTPSPATPVPTATPAATPTPTPTPTPPTQNNPWELVWNDEFDGQTIDAAKWNVQDTGTVYNNELEYYHPDNASLATESGQSVLELEARKQTYGGRIILQAS
ncbi:hypothetical protein ACFSQ7_12600 [Paenibacillus rhizoplanae]